MAGFRKAQSQQAFLKIGLYGPSGSGKTFTSLLIAEGLARASGKRIAFVDTEHGTDFYSKSVPTRAVHPEAFDFDALYSRSITEVTRDIRKDVLGGPYGVLVLDSMTHIWEACILAYKGRQTRIGTIPMQAWGQIKKPYKELMAMLLSAPLHVIICGRQGTEYADNDEGELKAVGYKMKAEGETAYEPHILLRTECVLGKQSVRGKAASDAIYLAHVEKDRTGVLAGKVIQLPRFENVAQPLLGLLGGVQAHIPTEEDVVQQDVEGLAAQERDKARHSAELAERFRARMALAESKEELKTIAGEITPEIKRAMTAVDLTAVRTFFLECERRFEGRGNGHAPACREIGDEPPEAD